ncbi:MAG: hypothetical protein WB791_06930 [Waddliaceae bacterium]
MKYLVTFLVALFPSLAFLCAEESCCKDINLQDKQVPYYGRIYYDNVLPATIKKKDIDHKKLRYQVAGVNAGSVFLYNPNCNEGLAATLGYDWTYLCWKGNPSFDQCNFQYLNLSLSGFSKRVKNWTWKANATMKIDPTNFNWSHYLCWDLLMWGRYAYSADIFLHVGFYAITGMNINRIYPVLGVEWTCTTPWRPLKLSLVFPFDISALWKINDYWEAGVAARFFQSRHRVDKNEPLPRGLWLYTAYGGELTMNYHYSDFIHANLHAGGVFGGELKIADRHWDNPRHFETGLAPYFGAEISLSY